MCFVYCHFLDIVFDNVVLFQYWIYVVRFNQFLPGLHKIVECLQAGLRILKPQ